jgi:hypothetical protein
MISLNQPSGGSFGSLSGAPGDNAALAAALALKLEKAGGIITGNGAASTPALTLNGTVFTGGSSTTTKPLHLIEPSGTTSNNWSTNGTMSAVNAPSSFTGDLFVGQIAGVNHFKADQSGLNLYGNASNFRVYDSDGGYLRAILAAGNWQADLYATKQGATSAFGLTYLNSPVDNFYTGLLLSSSGIVNFGGTTNYYDSPEFRMFRASSKNLGLAAWSGGAQSFSVYGTTDTTNYERLSLITAAGAYQIKPEAAGTGTLRDLHISGLPTSNPGPGILWNNAGTPAIGT